MKEEYGGMTVLERLHVSGLLNKFDSAVADRNVDAVIRILREVGINESIPAILESLGLKK